MTLQIRPVTPADHDAWLPLWQDYLVFYETVLPDEVTEAAWERIFDPAEPVGCLGAFDDDELVGFCHHLFHRSTWSLTWYCYLEDLYVAPEARRAGAARALIEATAELAVAAGSTKLYWQTHQTNARARSLYDQVAHHDGYLLYERELT